MKDLTKWQLISFISRGAAMFFGLVQSFFIVRLLSVTEWGVVQIAVSLGAALGIYQHLGLASASTREVSAAEDNKEIFKIFVTSAFIRYVITIPIAIGLFWFSRYLSTVTYNNPQLEIPLKLYAIVLLFQGFQSILNSVISGTRRFKLLFIYQAVISIVSVLLYIPAVWFYRVNGYFFALLAFNIISTFSLTIMAFRPLKGFFEMPSKSDFKRLFKELFSISLGIYLVKIIYTNWEKIGPNLLGLTVTPEIVGYFGFALLYAKKLMNVSDAVTDVNLPVFSDKFVHDRGGFHELFTRNFNRLYALIVFIGASAVFWVYEIVTIVVGSEKYNNSLPLMLPMVFAFIFYSFVNIVKSSVIIPAKLVKEMILSFVILIGGTLLFYFMTQGWLGNLQAMAYGMVAGGFLSFLSLALISQFKLGFKFINHDHWLILLEGLAISACWVMGNLYIKIPLYLVLTLLFIWGTLISGFVRKEEYALVFQKTREILSRKEIKKA